MRTGFLRMSRESGFLGRNPVLVTDGAVKTVEETTEDLGYYVRLGDKAAAGSSPVGKMPSNSITCERNRERKSVDAANCRLILETCHSRHPDPSAATNFEARTSSSERTPTQ